MNEVNQAIGSFNKVLQGQQKIGVEARLADADLLKLTAALFVAMFLAVLLANAITK